MVEHGFWVSFNFPTMVLLYHLPSFKRCRILAAFQVDTWLHLRPHYKTGLSLNSLLWEPHGGFRHTEMHSAERKPCIPLGLLMFWTCWHVLQLTHPYFHPERQRESRSMSPETTSVCSWGDKNKKRKKWREANFVQLERIPSGQRRNTKLKGKHVWFSPCARLVLWTSNKAAQVDWSEQEGSFRVTARRQEQPCALLSDVLLRSQTLRGWKWTLIKWWLHEFSVIALCHTVEKPSASSSLHASPRVFAPCMTVTHVQGCL